MLQRTILRASRQAARRTPTPAFAPLRQSTRVLPAPALRWYSDAPAAPKEPEAAEKKDDVPSDEAAKLKTDIEKKDREIVELKVRHFVARCKHDAMLTR
jgi:molecular chaperone GrpE